MDEPQNGKGFRLSLATLFSVSGGKPPELDQPRLIRLSFQTELGQTILELTLEPLGLCSVPEAHHKIIGIPDDDHITGGHFLAPSLQPQIEHMMQVHIGEQG